MEFDKTLEALKRLKNSAKKEQKQLKLKFQFVSFMVKTKVKQFIKDLK